MTVTRRRHDHPAAHLDATLGTDRAGPQAGQGAARRPKADQPVIAVVGERSAAARRDQLSWFESKPLFGWRVLVPRTKEQAASLSDQLRSYGAVPHEVPTIAVEPPRTPQQMERAVKGLVTGRYEWIAFTSRQRGQGGPGEVRGVRARRPCLRRDQGRRRRRADRGRRWSSSASSPTSCRAASSPRPGCWRTGRPTTRSSTRSTGSSCRAPTSPPRRWWPGLIELGWEVDDVTAYRTVRASPPPAETREAIKGGGFDAVLFTSSSTVRNLVGIAGKPHNVDGYRLYRPGHRQDGGGARSAGRRHVARAVGAQAGRGPRRRSARSAATRPRRRAHR